MATPLRPDYSEGMEQKRQQYTSSLTLPNASPSLLQTFHLFPLLPPELRLLIFKHSLSNTYVTYQRIKKQPPSPHSSHIPESDNYTYTTRLDKHRWMRLMLSCEMAHELAKNADVEVIEKVGKKEYWIYGRKWDEVVSFWREEGREFEEDAEFRW